MTEFGAAKGDDPSVLTSWCNVLAKTAGMEKGIGESAEKPFSPQQPV
jgi:hypothetical protein